MNHEQLFTAIVSSRLERGEELFCAEIWMGRSCCVLAVQPQENYQGVLCEVLDWSRRQGKNISWEYRLAKGTQMKRLISGPTSSREAVALTVAADHALSALEHDDLAQNEKVIERGVATFLEVGRALLDIKDRALYREGFTTFEGYCKGRWQMSARHAYRMCDAAGVVQNLLPASSDQLVTPAKLPTSESQARPLKGLEPDQQRSVWREAVQSVSPGDRVTATDVKRAREKLHPTNDALYWPKENTDLGRTEELAMVRVAEGSEIDRTNCHDLLKFSPKDEAVKLRRVFEFEGDLWVASLGHMGGSPPDKWTARQECHRLIPDNGQYRGPGDGKYFAEGRIVLWQNLRFRLGPTVIFEATGKRPTKEQANLEFQLECRAEAALGAPQAQLMLSLDNAIKAVSLFRDAIKAAKRPKNQIDCALSALGSLQHFQRYHLHPEEKKSPTAKKPDPFVLCRGDQSGRPTFRTLRGWTTDPEKALKFRGASEAEAAAHHDYDKPMALSKAKRKVTFNL